MKLTKALLGEHGVIRRTCARLVYGGSHPGRGTHNALLSLGDGAYLEVFAPLPGERDSEFGQFLATLPEFTPLAWAVTTTDVAATSEQLTTAGYEVTEAAAGSRLQEDGSTLRWTTMQITQPEVIGAPFFIEWSGDSVHPSESSPGGCTLEQFKLSVPEPDQNRDLFELLGVEISLEQDAEPGYSIALDCPRGAVHFGKE